MPNSNSSGGQMMMIAAVLVCFCLFLSSVATGGLFYYTGTKSSSSSFKPETISSSSSSSLSKPPESFDGFYSNFEEVLSIPNRGNTECRAYADEYNKTNPTTPYVAYGVRNSAHGTGTTGSGTCIFYKASGLETAGKADTSKRVSKVYTTGMDPKNYPNNFCLSTPPPEVSKDAYIGYYSAHDNVPTPQVGEIKCREYITTHNATPGISEDDKYVGFGVRDDNHPAALKQTCIFYKKKHLVDAELIDLSKAISKVTSKCTNGKSPANWCS